ncbi:MAG TPA: preprotein translocase subunit SecA [Acidimicrobiales bacterium]|nr:preprotein translocase subunit SecA [Acidimicrobiales bacterium]
MSVLDRFLRVGEGKKVKALQSLVPDIAALEPELEKLSDDALRAKTPEFRQRLDRGETLEDLLIEAFAVTREAGRRVLGQRHFDVQMMGGAALHFGWVAEMKTGEGKTLVSTLPAYLNGLSGRGMHLVTVNDYLATRDANWMGRLHRWMGLTVGLVVPGQPDPAYKRAQYACDLTYGTNNEFGFDYLRDNMAPSRGRQVQRGHVYAIVDEVDSILIDEARTPLIISGRVADAAQLYYKFASITRGLRRDDDYEVDEEKRTVVPTDDGIEKVEAALGVENLYDGVAQNLVHQLQAALRAKELFKRDKDYVVVGGEVKIVDEFTGRILEGRRWSEGLHQAVEAKEGVRIKEENQTLATVTLQNYFRMYEKLAGMTGTAQSDAAELANTYMLQVVPIPTNRPMIRADEGDLIYKTEDAKFLSVVDDIEQRHEVGQPVLVGTVSVEKSEKLSRLLDKRGIPHQVLNAKPDRATREAETIAQAGRPGTVTVATNMAGRGVDIILGGNPEGLAARDLRAEGLDPETDEGRARLTELVTKYEDETSSDGDEVRELGGLYVLGTERHDSRRIDNQLRGRSGRQGDPGESRFYLSLEDDLMRLFATGAVNWVMGKALPDDVPLEAKMVTKAIERAQTTVEQRNAEIRKNVLKYDEVMNEQRKVIYALRDQVLDKTDLRDKIVDEALPDAVNGLVEAHCVSEYNEEWDLEGVHAAVRTFWPSNLSIEQLSQATSTNELYEMLTDEALAHYERRESELTPDILRQVERQVMLRVIDQRWRAHLYEMDYLREGINLRAMGQKDPLVEWQREGFDMFGQMMHGIWQDFIRYVMHVQVQIKRPEAPTEGAASPDGEAATPAVAAADARDTAQVLDEEIEDEAGTAVRNLQYSAPEDPSSTGGSARMAAAASAAATATGGQAVGATARGNGNGSGTVGAGTTTRAPVANTPVVKSEWDKTPRNAPCPCGSGKKYKLCHGK